MNKPPRKIEYRKVRPPISTMSFHIRLSIAFIVVLSLLPISGEILAKEASPIYQFDLFGFQASKLELDMNKRMIFLSKALFTKTNDPFFKSANFLGNSQDVFGGSGAICIVVENKKYTVSWLNSETEGFEYRVKEMKEGEPCDSGYNRREMKETPQMSFSKLPTISDRFSKIRLGASTPHSVEAILGPPYCSNNKNQIFYFLKRDLRAEKGCFGKISAECYVDMKAIGVVFSFSRGVLKEIYMFNDLAGEC